MNVTINNCARCRSYHSEVVTYPFSQNPITVDGLVYDRYATCPVTDEPILVRTMVIA